MYGLNVDRNLEQSVVQQLIIKLRELILEKRLKSGDKLPPTRVLAEELKIARNSIIEVYEQLIAEGYLVSRVGSGTFVADLPELDKRMPDKSMEQRATAPSAMVQADKGEALFIAGQPEMAAFPRRLWAKLHQEVCLETPVKTFGYSSVQGEYALRRSIADYLFRSRSLSCTPEEIVVFSGTAQGIDLMAALFQDKKRPVGVEDPGDGFSATIFARRGLSVSPIPVDAQGICVEALKNVEPLAALYVVPSHQFPLGGMLPIQRRLGLIEYAEATGAFIIEDDYDGEFRYQGQPIPALRSLSTRRVIYLGTFSKTLAPTLRLSFAVIPHELKEGIIGLKETLNMRTPSLDQLVLARFLETKAMDRYVYKMKRIYAGRRRFLIHMLNEAFGEAIKITGENAGLHLVAEFNRINFDDNVRQSLLNEGIRVETVEEYALIKGNHRDKLVLGYGASDEEAIRSGVHRMRCALEKYL